jgi:hypothetical protein
MSCASLRCIVCQDPLTETTVEISSLGMEGRICWECLSNIYSGLHYLKIAGIEHCVSDPEEN